MTLKQWRAAMIEQIGEDALRLVIARAVIRSAGTATSREIIAETDLANMKPIDRQRCWARLKSLLLATGAHRVAVIADPVSSHQNILWGLDGTTLGDILEEGQEEAREEVAREVSEGGDAHPH